MPHSIYVVEDHPIMRLMLCELIESMPDLAVCGAAVSGEEALTELATLAPDVVLIDISLPGMSGIDLVEAIRERWPGRCCLMQSGHREVSYVERSLEAGAQGFVLKGSASELTMAIGQVLGGQVYLSPSLGVRARR